jgi:hypothetical protein
MPHRDHEVWADKDVQFAKLDLLHLVQIPCRTKHGEQRVAVAFELGPLVTGEGIVNGELVQAEFSRDRLEFQCIRMPGYRVRPPGARRLPPCGGTST